MPVPPLLWSRISVACVAPLSKRFPWPNPGTLPLLFRAGNSVLFGLLSKQILINGGGSFFSTQTISCTLLLMIRRILLLSLALAMAAVADTNIMTKQGQTIPVEVVSVSGRVATVSRNNV